MTLSISMTPKGSIDAVEAARGVWTSIVRDRVWHFVVLRDLEFSCLKRKEKKLLPPSSGLPGMFG